MSFRHSSTYHLSITHEVNAILLAYTAKLGLKVRLTNIGALKINGSTLKMFGIVLASVQVVDNLGRAQFFQETFLLANIRIDVILDTLAKPLPMIKRVQIINQKKFAAAALKLIEKAFVVHVCSLDTIKSIYLAQEVQVVSLMAGKVNVLKTI